MAERDIHSVVVPFDILGAKTGQTSHLVMSQLYMSYKMAVVVVLTDSFRESNGHCISTV